MHWFWRMIIAVVAGGVLGCLWIDSPPANALWWLVVDMLPSSGVFSYPGSWASRICTAISTVVPAILASFLVYGVLGLLRRKERAVETRCRQCGRILWGGNSPNCPECGTAVA